MLAVTMSAIIMLSCTDVQLVTMPVVLTQGDLRYRAREVQEIYLPTFIFYP